MKKNIKKQLLNRMNYLSGHLEGIKKMIEEEEERKRIEEELIAKEELKAHPVEAEEVVKEEKEDE